jgi:hypothetical protein
MTRKQGKYLNTLERYHIWNQYGKSTHEQNTILYSKLCMKCTQNNSTPVYPPTVSPFYGTKWLLWCPHRQSPTLHLKCEINQGLIERGSTIDH